MKKILSLLFLLSLTFFFCQKIELKKIIDSSQTFKGKIAGNSITLHLDYDGIIDCHQYQHFVKGWYYYDKYKKRIPLTGVYDLANLYLYNFGNRQKTASRFLHENITNLHLISKIDSIAKTFTPKETLTFNNDYSNKNETEGSFTMENKNLPAKLFTKDTRIYRYNNYLLLPNQKINTYDFINYAGGNQFISYATDKLENRVLLYFEEVSNFNYCGMCGASDGEKGYRVLHFSKDWKFKNYEEYLIESCREDIYNAKITKNTAKNIITISFTKVADNKLIKLTIDTKKVIIKKL